MKRLFAIVVCTVLGTAALQSSGVAEPVAAEEGGLLARHLDTARSQMDRGLRSREYRASLAFLRAHAAEATAEVSGLLLEERGGFAKWQATYLVGEFGDESAIALLRLLVDEPLPKSQPAGDGRHEIDLAYTEEVASRVQAVMSIARIASLRPDLREQTVAELVATAREVPLVKSTALFELRRLLGPDFQTLRSYFGPEDAKHFKPFMPPPEWQALLLRRMEEHRRQERELQEARKPVCQADRD
jgi:hypothetical protein